MSYTPVGWANDETRPLSQANMKTLDQGVLDAHEPLDVAEVTSGTASSLTLTVPAGVGTVRLVGIARSDASANRANLRVAVTGVSGTNFYRSMRVTWTGDDAAPSMSGGPSDASWNTAPMAAANASSTEFGSIELLIPAPSGGSHRRRMQWSGGVVATADQAEAAGGFGQGRVASTDDITSLTLTFEDGSFVVGSRFELLRG